MTVWRASVGATFAIAALTVASNTSQAAFAAYRCETFNATAYGLRRFSVDPRAGAVIGAPVWSMNSWDAVVMSPGSKRSALKLMLRTAGSSPWFLVVDEDRPGPRKPFTVLGDDVLLTGFCE